MAKSNILLDPRLPRKYQDMAKSSTQLRTFNSPSLNQSQIVSSFVSNFFPPSSLIPELSFFGNWLWCVPKYIGHSRALDCAAQCLALAYFGRMVGYADALYSSRRSYAIALRNLSKAISNKRSGLSSETLCTTMLLSLYEVCCNQL
jgi:hypothetical protein